MTDNQMNVDELTAFHLFVQVAGLSILDGSVQRRHPPEPDILCQLSSGEYVGFEMTEACSPNNIRFAKNAEVLGESLFSAYENMPPEIHAAFRARFAGEAISVTFEPEIGLSKAKRAIPDILVALLHSSPTSLGLFLDVPHQFPDLLKEVRFAGRCFDPDEPSFNVAGYFDISDMTTEAVRRKLLKRYVTSYPIELIVYYGGWAAHHLNDWRKAVPELLLQNGGTLPFQKIWIFEGKKIEACYSNHPLE
jgi:hypothetical protein